MNKTALVLALISVLLFLVVEIHFVNLAEANPFIGSRTIDPPPGTIPGKITILTPRNFTVYPGGILNITGIVAKPEGDYTTESAYFTVESYLNGGSHYLSRTYDFSFSDGLRKFVRSEVEFNRVLRVYNGSNELVIKVTCVVGVSPIVFFTISNNSTVFFTVDAEPPNISGLSVENKTYNEFELPLNFTVDESTSWVGYSLDNEANVTLSGNTTLALNEGGHSLVVYAEDAVGNIGTSETLFFTVEPFPTLLVATAIPAAVVLVSIGLLLYGIKRKR